jgi:hypothetical protein
MSPRVWSPGPERVCRRVRHGYGLLWIGCGGLAGCGRAGIARRAFPRLAGWGARHRHTSKPAEVGCAFHSARRPRQAGTDTSGMFPIPSIPERGRHRREDGHGARGRDRSPVDQDAGARGVAGVCRAPVRLPRLRRLGGPRRRNRLDQGRDAGPIGPATPARAAIAAPPRPARGRCRRWPRRRP